MMEPEDVQAKEMKYEDDGDLIKRLPENLFDHVDGEQWIRLLVGLAVELD